MKKIVIKISSNLLNPDLDIDIIENLAKEISVLKKTGYEIIIVTSGAVMYGVKTLGLEKKPSLLPVLQSCAAIGQIQLIEKYHSIFKKYDLITAQILLSTDDFKIRKRYLNLRNTVESLLESDCIPIFNENDSVNTEELKFGDNDHLSALITIMVNFDVLVILTDVNGVYDKDPNKDPNAKLLKKINKLEDKHFEFASDAVSKYSTGGMKKKLESALKCTKAGINVYIGNGFKVSIKKIADNKEIGTYISGEKTKVNAWKKWLGMTPTENWYIDIDEGAYKALKNNYSLLASGITAIHGEFEQASLINIKYSNKKIAQGLSNYSSSEIKLIMGKKSSEFKDILKSYDYNEVIHKNNLFLL